MIDKRILHNNEHDIQLLQPTRIKLTHKMLGTRGKTHNSIYFKTPLISSFKQVNQCYHPGSYPRDCS